MSRTDGDTWDLATSVGATATSVAASRAAASRGPHPLIDSDDPGEAGFSGSLIIAEFASLEEAQHWADEDPYVKAGVYQTVVTKPFKKVLPA